MARMVVMLRGINVGGKHKVAMAQLRALLEESGYTGVATYVQSGNVVLTTRKRSATVERELPGLLQDRFGFAIPVTVRSADELDAVIAHDPIPGASDDPKLYQVSFLTQPAPDDAVAKLRGLVVGEEQIAAHGRELYTWHPDGIARSKLASGLAAASLGMATARNWRTVLTLSQMARDDG